MRWARRLARLLALVGYYTWDLVRSNVRVARQVLALELDIHPAVVAVELEPLSDGELLTLTGLLTISPGTLSLDLSEDGRTLYVHVMDARDPDEVRELVKDQLERRILEVTR